MNLKLAFLAAAAATCLSLSAQATTLVENSGWQGDDFLAADVPSSNGPWAFTVADTAVFSIVDCCVVGDVYKLFDTATSTLLATTTYYAGSGVQADATVYGDFWVSADWSKLAYNVGPGSYSFTITSNAGGGAQGSFGVRLDSAAVPEAGTWALMIVGFAGMGAALRRRRVVLAAA